MIEHLVFKVAFQGLGAYAFVVPFFSLLATQLLGVIFVGAPTMQADVGTWNGVSLVISAFFVERLGWWFDRHPRTRWDDKENDWAVVRNTMFHIPMRYWAYFYGVLGLVVLGSAAIQ